MNEAELVDTLGEPCPIPVIELAKAVHRIDVGARVRLLSDDPAAKVDIPVWCRLMGHHLVEQVATGQELAFVVEKASSTEWSAADLGKGPRDSAL